MKYDSIYVVCPANKVTGGPDALHQMVYYLNKIGRNATIVYYLENKKQFVEIPVPYRAYVNSFLLFEDTIDSESSAVIFPEMYSFLSSKIRKAKVFIWWLSVNNNSRYTLSNKCFELAKALKNRKFHRIKNILQKKRYDFGNKNYIQLCASQYAYEYVKDRTNINVYKCIEPISLKFLEQYYEWDGLFSKEDIVLYNPAKCEEYVRKLIDKKTDIKFLPLKGYSQDELIDLYKRAKVYIDFGPFPGAERMPKEAVLYGDVIITGKHGASSYFEDVRIYDEYKIDEDAVPLDTVLDKIVFCLKQYDSIKDDFNEYRDMVLSLEEGFLRVLETLF